MAKSAPITKVLRLFCCTNPDCSWQEFRWREYRPVAQPRFRGEDEPLPVHCENCGAPCDQVLRGIGNDLLPASFVIDDVDGKGSRRISSLAEIRAIERESERKFRDGTGQILNFREFTQDRGNKLRNSFEGTAYQRSKSQLPERRQTLSNLPINIHTTK